MAVHALIATHGVVMDTTARVLWVSESPHLLGRFVGFDLRRALSPGYDPAQPGELPGGLLPVALVEGAQPVELRLLLLLGAAGQLQLVPLGLAGQQLTAASQAGQMAASDYASEPPDTACNRRGVHR